MDRKNKICARIARTSSDSIPRPGVSASNGPGTAVSAADEAAVLVDGNLSEVLVGRLGEFAIKKMRIRPRQARAIESVGRILSAGVKLSLNKRSAESISIGRVASEAGVTPQAAYRYFKDIGELVDTGLRCIVIREHERVVEMLSGCVLASEIELARAVVGIILEARERIALYPAQLRESLLHEYRQVGDDASSLMSKIMCEDVDPSDVRHSLEVIKLTVALTTMIAVTTSPSFRIRSPLRGGDLETMLVNLFTTVLQSTRESFNTFQERDVDICGLLTSEVA